VLYNYAVSKAANPLQTLPFSCIASHQKMPFPLFRNRGVFKNQQNRIMNSAGSFYFIWSINKL